MKLWSVGILALAVALIVGTTPVQAGKGLKKNGEHHHHGTVIGVEKKGEEAVIEIKLHHHKKKKGVEKTKTKTAKFTATVTTKFELVHGKERLAASLSHVRIGEHVSIAAKKHHADVVAIHKHTHAKIARQAKSIKPVVPIKPIKPIKKK
jgi:hypothetical protein